MSNKVKLLFATVLVMFGAFSFALAPQVGAQGQTPLDPQQGLDSIRGAYPNGATQERTVSEIARTIIQWALALAAIVAVLFLIYGGFLYITSAGDQTQATKGKGTIVNAIIGLVIVVLSYMVIQVVYNFLIS